MAKLWLWTGVMAVAFIAMVTAAPPMDSTGHLDIKKESPPEFGSDDEVRQLLDLKGLAAQRDLGNLKRQVQSGLTPSPDSAATASSVVLSKEDNKGNTEDQPKNPDETVKQEEEKKEEQKNTDKAEASGVVEGNQEHPEADHQVEDDHIQLKRQQLIRPHVQYTPLDLALYVYKTGDEEGVTLAIQELIAEGLMTAEEALNYLREIRENLRYLNQQDEQVGLQLENEREASENVLKPLIKKNSLPLPLTEMTLADPDTMLTPEMDYENLLERIRGQDYVSTEYSLEEVIYQLAKILFKQAMHREGDIGSEKALQEVAALLEKEAARGAITPEVEKKVLDVMVNSLVDSISENEFPSGTGPVIGGPTFKLPNQSPFPMGNSAMIGGSNFKPTGGDLFQLTKTTTKREAPSKDDDAKKITDEKTN